VGKLSAKLTDEGAKPGSIDAFTFKLHRYVIPLIRLLRRHLPPWGEGFGGETPHPALRATFAVAAASATGSAALAHPEGKAFQAGRNSRGFPLKLSNKNKVD